MRTAPRLLASIGLVLATVSCGDVSRTGKSPVYLVIDSLQGARGDKPSQFGNPLGSSVITLITTGGACSTQNPCPTVFNDLGQVTMRIALKNITNPSSPNAPTTNNEVTITRYHVQYVRTDGRNTEGLDVPYAFDGALTFTVPFGAPATAAFELVRHVAKEESPLVQLLTNPSVISTFAQVTFYGTDRVGNDVAVTGNIQINFGNFGTS